MQRILVCLFLAKTETTSAMPVSELCVLAARVEEAGEAKSVVGVHRSFKHQGLPPRRGVYLRQIVPGQMTPPQRMGGRGKRRRPQRTKVFLQILLPSALRIRALTIVNTMPPQIPLGTSQEHNLIWSIRIYRYAAATDRHLGTLLVRVPLTKVYRSLYPVFRLPRKPRSLPQPDHSFVLSTPVSRDEWTDRSFPCIRFPFLWLLLPSLCLMFWIIYVFYLRMSMSMRYFLIKCACGSPYVLPFFWTDPWTDCQMMRSHQQ